MSHVPHDLAADFPGDVERIHALRAVDKHFARLVEAYHEVNRTIHRYETRVETVSDEEERAARKEWAHLKDAIAARLAQAAA